MAAIAAANCEAISPVSRSILKSSNAPAKRPASKSSADAYVIERTFSWLRRNRRLIAHYEALAVMAEAFAKLAMIAIMLKRLTEVTK